MEYRINQISIPVHENVTEAVLIKKAAHKLNIDYKNIESLKIFRRSVDSRKKNDIRYIFTVDVKVNKAKVRTDRDVEIKNEKQYSFPFGCPDRELDRPVIVGFGPAGMFCAYMLARNGFKPIVLERGSKVDERTESVEKFWNKGVLDSESNVQFGEGGAGTFSDGKLNTLVKDKFGRNREVLKVFVEHGAPEYILYENKPHIGTDILVGVVKNIREDIIAHGGEIHFNTKADSLILDGNKIKGVAAGKDKYMSEHVVLCVGHSARDTFEMLKCFNVPMSPKAFAVGMRVMHPQEMIDRYRYGEKTNAKLPVADYKLTYTDEFGRGVYSFCMCPGGYVVNASSEGGRCAVNGMSYSGRNSGVANSAIVVQVTPGDWEDDSVLGGMYFQRELEQKAYEAGRGAIPVQKYSLFSKSVTGEQKQAVLEPYEPCVKGMYEFADLSGIMPKACNDAFVKGMTRFGQIIENFDDGNVLLAGIESRTSSPVRIERDERGESEVSGLFPCGEGAGYAGGITSAAMDGIFIAECIAADLLRS